MFLPTYLFLPTTVLPAELRYISNLPFPGSLFGKLTVKLVLILLPNKRNQITTCTLEIANSPLERAEVHNWSAIANLKKHTHWLREAAEESPTRKITALENMACEEALEIRDCSVRPGKQNKSPGIVRLLQREGIKNHPCPLTVE